MSADFFSVAVPLDDSSGPGWVKNLNQRIKAFEQAIETTIPFGNPAVQLPAPDPGLEWMNVPHARSMMTPHTPALQDVPRLRFRLGSERFVFVPSAGVSLVAGDLNKLPSDDLLQAARHAQANGLGLAIGWTTA